MAQLKMYWLAGTPAVDLILPKGYSVSNYKEKNDIYAWIECCKDGLVADDADESTFKFRITDHPFTTAEKDLFFLDFNGEHIGTVTAVYHPDKNCGEVHMVGIRPDFRGKGLGKYLNDIAVKKLDSQGVDYIYLTTDEWRKGAVKSYLTSGFLPVEYDEGMQERWEAVISDYGIDSVDMVNEDCSFFKKIYKSKQ